MVLNDNYYISERKSMNYPAPYRETGTLFIPVNVRTEDGMYCFEEYRLSLPITYPVPVEVAKTIADALGDFTEKVKQVVIEGEEKEGFHYEAKYSASGITHHLVKDVTAEVGKGTYDNPLWFTAGMKVTDGLYYISDDGTIYACIKGGVAESLTDSSMFLPC